MFPVVETAGVEPASLDVTNSQSLQLPRQIIASSKITQTKNTQNSTQQQSTLRGTVK